MLDKLQKRSCRAIMTLHLVLLLNPQINVKMWPLCLFYRYHYRSSYQRCSVNKVFLEISQNSQENTFSRDSSFNKVAGLDRSFIQKETLARVFSCEFCEISKNTSGRKLLTTFGKRLVELVKLPTLR